MKLEIDDAKKLKRFWVLLTHSKAVDARAQTEQDEANEDDELANHPTTENGPEDAALNAIKLFRAGCFVKADDDKYRDS